MIQLIKFCAVFVNLHVSNLTVEKSRVEFF